MDETGNDDPLIGRVFASRYRIEQRLGAGAMGEVYRARHVKVGRPFAVKMLHERFLVDDKQRRRFEREAELAGKLHHINCVGVVDVGETEDGIHFMVMEFAVGQPLTNLMTGPLPAARVIHLVRQLCDGLQHAHEHGLIHRDLKPDNVIVERDGMDSERPRIVDFGISILRDEAETPGRADRLTTAGLILGTPHYMAPEHAMGGGIDHRIDLFALGVILFELLTGRLPFDGDGVDVARANLLTATPAMGVRVPGVVVDPLLEALTRALMEKEPGNRPQSAQQTRALLDLIATDRSAAATALGVALTDGRHPALAAALSVPVPRAEVVGTARAAVHDRPSDRRGTEPSTEPSTEPTIAPRRRLWAVALGAGLVTGIAAIVVMLTRGHGSATAPADARAPIAIAEPAVIDAGAGVADPRPGSAPADATALPGDAATAAADAPIAPADAAIVVAADAATGAIRPHAAVRPTPKPRPTKDPVPKPAVVVPAVVPAGVPAVVPAVDPTSASAVAQLYGAVGRELKRLDTRTGSAATASLWPRYLRIRINDALTTADKRIEAHRLLSSLRREIAAQR